MFRIIVFYCLMCVCVCYKSRTDMENIYTNVTTGYNKYIRPGSQGSPTHISLTLHLVGIKELEEQSGRFTVSGLLQLFWNDERVQWDTSNYGNIDTLNLRQDDVWRPDLSMSNPFSSMLEMGYDDVFIKYDEHGYAGWQIPAVFDSVCDINVKYFPFDEQTCSLKFISLGYPPTKINLQPRDKEINMTLMSEHAEWKIISTSIVNSDLADHASITMTLILSRRFVFFVINIFLPLILLTLLSSMVFFLPADSGERVGFSVACLLAIMVYLTLVAESLPKSSTPIPNLGIILLCDLIFSTIVCVFTIFGLRLHHMDSSTDVPGWVVSLLDGCRGCFKKKRKVKPVGETENYSKTFNDLNNQNGISTQLGRVVNPVAKSYTWKQVGQSFDVFCFLFANLTVTLMTMTYVMTSNVSVTS